MLSKAISVSKLITCPNESILERVCRTTINSDDIKLLNRPGGSAVATSIPKVEKILDTFHFMNDRRRCFRIQAFKGNSIKELHEYDL